MADTVNVRQIVDGPRNYVTRLTNFSDGTGENGVTKIDISTFYDSRGKVATYTAIDKIVYSVSGFGNVRLVWDHTVDDVIAVMEGQGTSNFRDIGGLVDPRSAGGTGDILVFTTGTTPGSSYDITIYWRPKS